MVILTASSATVIIGDLNEEGGQQLAGELSSYVLHGEQSWTHSSPISPQRPLLSL